MVAQAIVNEFCRSGALERSIATVKRALGERAARLCEGLRRELPEARFVEPQGGYFLWVELPEGTDGEALFRAAADRGVAIVKGTDFLLEGGENAFRLAVANLADAGARQGRTHPAWRASHASPARTMPDAMPAPSGQRP